MHTIWRYNCGTFLKEMHASQEIMYSLPLMEPVHRLAIYGIWKRFLCVYLDCVLCMRV